MNGLSHDELGLPPIMRRVLDAYHAHDVDDLAAQYSPSCILRFPGFEAVGRDAIANVWQGWFTAFPDVRSDIFRAPQQPGTVALEWEERGTHAGNLELADFHLRPSGRRLSWRGVSIYRFDEQGIQSIDYHADRLTLVLQLMTFRSLVANVPAFLGLLREQRRRASVG